MLEPLEEFRGSATVRQTPQQRRRLQEFAEQEYARGRSLREIAELTDRTQAAVRRALAQVGVSPRPRGARVVHEDDAGQ